MQMLEEDYFDVTDTVTATAIAALIHCILAAKMAL